MIKTKKEIEDFIIDNNLTMADIDVLWAEAASSAKEDKK